MRKSLTIIMTILIILPLCLGGAFAGETPGKSADLPYKVFRTRYANCTELLPIVKLYLSKDGKAVVLKRTNSIIVKDHLENLNKIEQIIKGSDIPLPQVRVNIKFLGRSSTKNNALYASAVKKGKYWRIGIHPNFSSSSQNVNKSMNLLILSGSSGFIRFGENVPYTTWFYKYAHRLGYVTVKSVNFLNVSTGFYVTPQVRGDGIYISVAPGISYFDGKNRNRIIFKEARTEVFVKDGQTVVLGVGDSSREGQGGLISHIIGGGSFKSNEVFSIMMTVRKVKGL